MVSGPGLTAPARTALTRTLHFGFDSIAIVDRPLAFFLTWTCYGTWLHGDGRGSVDDMRNTPGAAVRPVDAGRVASERRAMTGLAVTLDERGRGIVAAAILECCTHRGWEILALNARSNHVHVVVSAVERPESVMGTCKAWGTRRLRDAGIVAATQAVWTRHGSTRYLWKEADVAAALAYVEEGQDVSR